MADTTGYRRRTLTLGSTLQVAWITAPYAKLGILFVACLLAVQVGLAQDSEFNRQSLKGLSGVCVAAGSLSPEAEEGGLTKSAIEAEAEMKLRLAGIPVLSREADRPCLFIRITAMKIPTGGGNGASFGYAAAIDVSVIQQVLLKRDTTSPIPDVSTWSRFWLMTAGPGNLQDAVRPYVTDLVGQFVKAYQSMNPK